MKKKIIFRGVSTALITPFKRGKIDYESLGKIIDGQISAGINALTVGGTTGEASTLSDSERYELYRFAREKTLGKIPLILGTGSNDTKKAIQYTKLAEELSADGALIVTPYYNKGTEEGVFRHFAKIAEECSIRQILYNVPSRTGVNISIKNLTRLGTYENIVGIKEASGNLTRLQAISELEEVLPLYSGNDSEAYITMALGGAGVISVVSNLYPQGMLRITDSFLSTDFAGSLKAQRDILRLADALFLETNPAPIKYAMKLRGLCTEQLRLPLFPPSTDTKRAIRKVMEQIPDLTN